MNGLIAIIVPSLHFGSGGEEQLCDLSISLASRDVKRLIASIVLSIHFGTGDEEQLHNFRLVILGRQVQGLMPKF